MRWKGIIVLLILAGVFLALAFLLTDRWLEKRLEAAGTSLLGAQVEIDNLDVSLLKLHVRWDSLQATNPNNTMKNIFTTGPTEFDMQLGPLFRKKVIIDNIQITNISSGTDRTTDGKIERRADRRSQKPTVFTRTIERLKKQTADAPVWDMEKLSHINLDSILTLVSVSSPEKIDSLKSALAMTYDKWDSAFAKVSWEKDFAYLSSRIEAIEPEKIQTLEGLQTAYSTLGKVRTHVDSLGKFVKDSRKHLSSDLDDARAQIALVDDWIVADYSNALKQAHLPRFDKAGVAQILFGSKVTNQAAFVLGLIDQARRYAQKFKPEQPKEPKPPRAKGQTIYFSSKQNLPDLWIKNILLSGHSSSGLKLAGNVENIVSNQRLIGKPTRAVVNSESGSSAASELKIELNYLEESPFEQVQFSAHHILFKNVELTDTPVLSCTLASGRGDIKAGIESRGDELTAHIDFGVQEAQFEPQKTTGDELQQILFKVLSGAKRLGVTAELHSNLTQTKFSIASNLDELLAKEIRAIGGENVARAQKAIEAKVKSQIDPVKNDFDAYVAEKTAFLEAEIKKNEELFAAQQAAIDAKKAQLEKRMKEEKEKLKKGVEDEARKRLKGLFN